MGALCDETGDCCQKAGNFCGVCPTIGRQEELCNAESVSAKATAGIGEIP